MLVALGVVVSLERSKNPSLTLRVSFWFSTLLSWWTKAEREKRNIKTHASGFLWFFQAFCLVDWGGAKKYIVGHAGHSFGAERS